LRTYFLQFPRIHDQEAWRFWSSEWNDQQEREDEDAWPFYLEETNELGQMRYRLTCLEKEHLKSLGLPNLFTTAWPKPPHHS
jgi:hypothetical protein